MYINPRRHGRLRISASVKQIVKKYLDKKDVVIPIVKGYLLRDDMVPSFNPREVIWLSGQHLLKNIFIYKFDQKYVDIKKCGVILSLQLALHAF